MADQNVSLRRAVVEDVSQLSRLFGQLDEHHIHLRPHLFKRFDGLARSDESIRALITSIEEQAVFVAETGSGELLGFVHVLERHSPETVVARATNYAEIDAVAVKTGFRRRGLAKALIDKAEEWAKARSLPQLMLSVRAFNHEAVAAYRALGFEHIVHKMARSIPS